MNHRDLIKSADKKVKFHFLQLPDELQDFVIDRLDKGELTLEAASAWLKAQGYSLSYEAISGYYRAVRRERRLFDLNSEITRLIADFANRPVEENLRALVSLVISTTAVGLADGNISIKPIDIGKFLAATQIAKAAEGGGAPIGPDESVKAPGGLTDKAAEELRNRILLGK
jgi:hypothetical protein